jgi:diguanylate cyclase (GGDEF)-like protein
MGPVSLPSKHFAGGPLARARGWRVAARIAGAVRRRLAGRRPIDVGDVTLAGVLDLFEEHVYIGEITVDGAYVDVSSGPMMERLVGGAVPAGIERGAFWESLIHGDDRPGYLRFNRRLLDGRDADARYRLVGIDGVTRSVWDRARPLRRADGSMLVQGIISDVTGREEADARAAEAAERFTGLLDVVGEHVYLAVAHPDGRVEELFQGPGADRLLGGAEPDPEMTNWEAAIHPDDRAAYDAFNLALGAGRTCDVEYRLIGADGITRWVHDRAATRRRRDGTVEISGIVSDVTEQRRLRAELGAAHAAVSRVVEAMDDHLYTLRVDPDGSSVAVYRGPHRAALVGGPLPGGVQDDRLWATLLHPEDRERWRATFARLGEGRPVEVEYRVEGLDGVERIVLDQLRPRREPDGTLYFDGVTRDVTERRHLEDELRRSMAKMQEAHRELDAAHRAAELQARTDDLTGTYNRRHFAELVTAAAATGATDCGLLLLDADHFKQVNDVHGHAVGDAVLVELARRLRSELGQDELLARWGGEEFAVLVRAIGSDAALRERAERLRRVVRATPIHVDSTTIRLTVSLGGARGAGPLVLDAWVESADRALYAAKGRGRDRVCLATEVRGLAMRTPESGSETLARAVAFATGLRADAETTHSDEVADLAARVATRLGLPDGMVLRCRLGGWLHDIGKVAIPHAILDKPGPLDGGEWAVMRTHPVHSEAIVKRIGALRESAAAVRHHHERYDGTGYPDGLAAHDIPVEARIIAAADAYCAMTTDRVYSAARPPHAALQELRRCAGTHFDPEVVRALEAVVGPAAAVAPLRDAA